MDIRDVQSTQGQASEQVRRARSGAQPGEGAAGAAGGGLPDQVTLSGRAQAFQQARDAALAVPELRQDRVDEVRRRLAEGGLVPDPHRIAAALIGQGLLG